MNRKEYDKAVKDLFNNPNGKKILEYWYSSYASGSSFNEKPERTYYNLGQADLVREIICDSLSEKNENYNIELI